MKSILAALLLVSFASVSALADSPEAIMGNHEYNAVCYHTPDGKGDWLREHSEEKNRQVTATLRAFEGRENEWSDWLEWMKRLWLW